MSIAGVGLFVGCGVNAPQAEPPVTLARAPTLTPRNASHSSPKTREPDALAKQEHTAFGILGGHDTPNPGGSQDIHQFVSDLRILGMKTAVTIDPSAPLIDTLDRAGIKLIVRLVQEHNVFHEQHMLWTLNKLKNTSNFSLQPFNEPNIEGVEISPEDHVRVHFTRAATVILPMIALRGGTLLLTPLAPYALFQGIEELEAYRRMLTTVRDEVIRDDHWMWKHIRIGAHVYPTTWATLVSGTAWSTWMLLRGR